MIRQPVQSIRRIAAKSVIFVVYLCKYPVTSLNRIYYPVIGFNTCYLFIGEIMADLPCPAVKELITSLRCLPYLVSNYREPKGVMLPRLQWRSTGGLNRHDAGLALDIILFANVRNEKILAQNLVKLFVENLSIIHWRSIIYEQVVFSSNGIPAPYTQDCKHVTHIHIDWLNYSLYEQTGRTSIPWSSEAYTSGFSGELVSKLILLENQWLKGELVELNLMNLRQNATK
jgi:hypothetical protein